MVLQGEDRDTKWVLYVLSFWFSLFGGILFAVVAISWVIHIVVYVIVDPPLHPFLNSMFEALDDVFVFFGVIAFSIWCFFLILAAIKGFTKLGLNFGLIQLYPMKACPLVLPCSAAPPFVFGLLQWLPEVVACPERLLQSCSEWAMCATVFARQA